GAGAPLPEGPLNRHLLVLAIVEGLVIVVLAALLATGGSDAAPAPGAGPDAAPAAPERSPVPAAVSLELAGSLAERRELSEAPSSNGYDASRGTLLHGRVVDQNGAPIAGARISVRRPGARRGQDAAYAEG